jgi:hypothetical protein
MGLLLLLAFLGFLGVVFTYGKAGGETRAGLEALADEFGLELAGSSLEPRLSGRVDGHALVLERAVDRRFQLTVSLGVEPDLQLRPRLALAGVGTGDEGFDAVYTVTGPETVALTVLDAVTRGRLLDVEVLSPRVGDGQLQLSCSATAEVGVLRAMVLRGVQLSDGLAAAHDAGLGAAFDDPVPEVRIRALRAMVRDRPEAAATFCRSRLGTDEAALISATRGAAPEALAAAVVLGDVGGPAATTALREAAARLPAHRASFDAAVAKVRARLGDRASGGLSLSQDGASGPLSQASTHRAAITRAREDPARGRDQRSTNSTMS